MRRQATADDLTDGLNIDAMEHRIVLAMLVHRTGEDIAQAAGVHRATVYRKIKEPRFTRALQVARKRFQERQVDLLAAQAMPELATA